MFNARNVIRVLFYIFGTLLIIAAITIVIFLVSSGSHDKDGAEPSSSPEITNDGSLTEIHSVSMYTLYEKLLESPTMVKATIKYLSDTDSISINLPDVKQEDWKDVFVIQDTKTGSIYLRRTNYWDGLSPEDSISTITLEDGMTYESISRGIFDDVTYYINNTIPKDAGDEVLGEDAQITTNPDGSFSVVKE